MSTPLPDALRAAVGGQLVVSQHEADRVAYARDLWPRHLVEVREGREPAERPQAIAWPTTTEEAAAVVSWCAKEGVPMVPFGAGSGVCGGILPNGRTLVVDLKKMKRWRALDEHAPTLEVEAGAMGITLEEDLQRKGFTIGHFPSSILCSTVGGWIAARGAGQASGYYGKIEDMVVDVELIDGRGDVVRARRRTTGPDLVPMIVGSEGTLGVITSATMRLHPAPRARSFGSFAFASTEEGWECMRALFQRGLRPAVSRLYDPFDAAIARRGAVKAKSTGASKVHEVGAGATMLRTILKAPRAMNGLIEMLEGFGAGDEFRAMLILIFEGDDQSTTDGLERARAIARTMGGEELGEGPAQRWLTHRYSVSYRLPPMFRAGTFVDTMEVAAPWSKLEGLYRDVRRALGAHVFVMAHLSHAYPDGCSIYFTFAGVGGDEGHGGERALARYDRTWRDALDAAISAGGTLSHHHGVGRSKAPRLGRELGVGVDVVRALKRAFDPSRLFNLGNLLPDDAKAENPADFALPTSIAVDAQSLLVSAPADARLESLEAAAASIDATLRLDRAMLGVTVGAWLDAGCPGSVDRYRDPVDHAIAGLDARLPDGRILHVQPGPRRAVGPDLTSLVVGARGRFAVPLSASVRVHRRDTEPPSTAPFTHDRDPKIGDDEERLFDAIAKELAPR